jgi:hypothetical protein
MRILRLGIGLLTVCLLVHASENSRPRSDGVAPNEKCAGTKKGTDEVGPNEECADPSKECANAIGDTRGKTSEIGASEECINTSTGTTRKIAPRTLLSQWKDAA